MRSGRGSLSLAFAERETGTSSSPCAVPLTCLSGMPVVLKPYLRICQCNVRHTRYWIVILSPFLPPKNVVRRPTPRKALQSEREGPIGPSLLSRVLEIRNSFRTLGLKVRAASNAKRGLTQLHVGELRCCFGRSEDRPVVTDDRADGRCEPRLVTLRWLPSHSSMCRPDGGWCSDYRMQSTSLGWSWIPSPSLVHRAFPSSSDCVNHDVGLPEGSSRNLIIMRPWSALLSHLTHRFRDLNMTRVLQSSPFRLVENLRVAAPYLRPSILVQHKAATLTCHRRTHSPRRRRMLRIHIAERRSRLVLPSLSRRTVTVHEQCDCRPPMSCPVSVDVVGRIRCPSPPGVGGNHPPSLPCCASWPSRRRCPAPPRPIADLMFLTFCQSPLAGRVPCCRSAHRFLSLPTRALPMQPEQRQRLPYPHFVFITLLSEFEGIPIRITEHNYRTEINERCECAGKAVFADHKLRNMVCATPIGRACKPYCEESLPL